VELASPELIGSLKARLRVTNAPPLRRDLAVRSSITHPKRHCRCGQCPICLENARWDQIFAEKFADPITTLTGH
jgi:hypothetical protein